MVRISELGSSEGTNKTVRLEGRVVGRSVMDVQQYCEGVLSQGLKLTIDMSDVSFLDQTGIELFRKLVNRQVRLINCSAFVAEVLKPVRFEIR